MLMLHSHLLIILTIFFLLFLFIKPARATRYSPSPSALGEWRSARATYYAVEDTKDPVGGACGYGDLMSSGYGKATAGLSEALFERGQICGACYEIRCVEDLKWCIAGTSIIVTATNFCPPNYGLPADGGGHCNPPNRHFVMPIQAFEKIAIWKASNMPVQYRRYASETNVRFPLANVRWPDSAGARVPNLRAFALLCFALLFPLFSFFGKSLFQSLFP